jgi:hypothetical protein
MTNSLELEPAMRRAVDSAVLISGGGRSGTTVLGKLLHTFQGVEYVFEPPTLIALFSQFDTLPESAWRFLYEAYLSEEFLANALAGRAINTNKADDSSVLVVKTAQEIERRLDRSWSKLDVMQAAAQSTIAYKIPNIVPLLERFHSRYPGNRIIVIKRGFAETIQSLMRKGWFRDLGPETTLHWPFRNQHGIRVPYWVSDGDEALWCSLNEVDRCAYYYLRMSDAPPEGKNILHLGYASLVAQPEKTAQQLADLLGLTFGEKTPEVLATIAPTGKPVDNSILEQISPRFRDEVLHQSALSE